VVPKPYQKQLFLVLGKVTGVSLLAVSTLLQKGLAHYLAKHF